MGARSDVKLPASVNSYQHQIHFVHFSYAISSSCTLARLCCLRQRLQSFCPRVRVEASSILLVVARRGDSFDFLLLFVLRYLSRASATDEPRTVDSTTSTLATMLGGLDVEK